MFSTRILPPEEWHRLAHTDMPTVLPYVEPEDIRVVVVESGDVVVGCWAVLRVVHLEGVWIHPTYRGKGSVARRLLTATLTVARQWTSRWAMTGANSDDVRHLLVKHLGARQVPMDTFVIPMEGTPCR